MEVGITKNKTHYFHTMNFYLIKMIGLGMIGLGLHMYNMNDYNYTIVCPINEHQFNIF